MIYSIVIIVLLVIINALEDAFRDTNKKVLAHLFNSLHIAGWFFMMQYDLTVMLVIEYILIRFALFHILYNMIKGVDIFYVGTTSIYGKFWTWFEKWTKFPLNHLLFWLKLISLLLAISFYFTY